MSGAREDILALLESNSRLLPEDLAERLGLSAEFVSGELGRMCDEQVICGYNTLINWEKTNKELVTALIEVRVTPQRGLGFDKIAERIYLFDEVKAVYLMSGGFDLTVIIEGGNIKDVAYFISDKLAPMESVQSTATHFVLKKYKDHGIVLEKQRKDDERMIVSP
ncbi:MAG: Lrp/AsnC family transcriptional regulator [Clostridiales bacterium]|jgi:DNA-binding Lrp family transcriptional regulator|nr:Lrp/AsnC family transcriptional regulator [Clostridiales bacterium]